jgi:hypothetical protein
MFLPRIKPRGPDLPHLAFAIPAGTPDIFFRHAIGARVARFADEIEVDLHPEP